MNASEPMARRSQQPAPAPRRDRDHWIRIGLVIVACWGAWEVAASIYRSGHCVLFLGHWLAVGQAAPLGFCQ
jgi:hypothetical protein